MSFIGLAVAAGITVIGGIAQSGAAQDAANQQNQYTQQDQELNFQRQAWLAQQQRGWQLQDRQFKGQSIAEFSGDWGNNQKGIVPANQNAQLAGLDQFNPNTLGSVGATGALGATGAPGATGTTPPGPTGPLSQLALRQLPPPGSGSIH